jgi:hypothetical protein
VDIWIFLTLLPRIAGVALALLAAAPAHAEATGAERLGQFTDRVMGAFSPEGRFDPVGFGCAEGVAVDPGLQECRDPASGLGFLFLPSDSGDDLSVTVTRKDPAALATDLQILDRAEAEALRSAFVALPDAAPFAGLPRCTTGGNRKDDKEVAPASFAVVHPLGGQPVTFIFGGMDAAAMADLATTDGTLPLTAILVASRIGLACAPVE